MKEWVRYTIVVLAYIGLAMLTKKFLTWTWGPIYFVTMLEAVPRIWHRIRYRRPMPSSPEPKPDLVPGR